MLFTSGFNYYKGYDLHISVTEGLCALNDEQAADYCKIIYIKNGATHFKLNEKEFILTGASTICMNEQDRITFYKVMEDDVRIIWFKPTIINLKFTKDVLYCHNRLLTLTENQDLFFLMQFTGDAEETMKILSLNMADSMEMQQKYQILKETLTKQNSAAWPCRSRSYLFEILFSLVRQEDDELRTKHVLYCDACSRLAIDVIYYLQTAYNQKVTIEKLATVFHTNRTTLINDFKKYTGKSINQYLIDLRLTMASTLLRDTELSADEICEKTGFNDISYFSKVFKKKLSCTPTEYRKVNQHQIY